MTFAGSEILCSEARARLKKGGRECQREAGTSAENGFRGGSVTSFDRAEELETNAALASALVAAQFPDWAHLPILRVEAASTDNDLYRLGADLAVRLPRRASAVEPIDKEHEWLPHLAPRLPAPIPVPLARGAPGQGYPFAWGVVRWIEGGPPADPTSETRLAIEVAGFISALHGIDASSGPPAGAHNYWRGAPLSAFDRVMRRRFEWLSDLGDIGRIVEAWEMALCVAPWADDPMWIHGDLKGANLLIKDGGLSGVLDWSAAGVGDPAVDVAVAWTLFDGDAREAFRGALGADDTTWARGRAWALIEGVFGLSYYRDRSGALASEGRRVIDVVLSTES
jgi:aminoglycoside phosphotransferase (APT) family kinase protein